MAHILIMPRQGNTVESCIITDWKVKEGDDVTPETIVCEVETDKASFEVPAGAGGAVLKLLHASGDDVPVLKPIAVIGATGEDWQAAISQEAPDKNAGDISVKDVSKSEIKENQEKNTSSPCEINQEIAISPRARNLAAKENLTVDFLGTGPGHRVIERDVLAALQNRPPLTAAARAAGPGQVPAAGSGLGGRITAADLSSGTDLASGARKAGVRPDTTVIQDFGEGAITDLPIKGIRRIIADRMFKSLAESAQFTLNASAPANKLQNFRSGVKNQESLAVELGLTKITINDLILLAVSRTLPRFPFMNAHKTRDTIRVFERVHLGLAVDTPRGLMVPVIRNASLLSLTQISSEAKRLAEACQNGSAKPDELSGSTFTVTNLGSMGITSFTPVLNVPEVAILGVCAIEMKPAAQATADHQLPGAAMPVIFEPHIGFSLTIDHQAVDGAPAARFLKALGDAVAHIDLLLAAG